MSRAKEINRDELKFTKFVQRIRKKFTPLFTDILKTQLLLKGVISLDDWKLIQEHIQYDFLADGHFAELKDSELLNERLNNLGTIESYIGTFFSKEYVMKKVLRMTDNEMDEMQRQISKEEDIEPEDGGIDIPQDTDGITRYPSQGGNPIPPDDVAKYDGQEVDDEEK